MNQLKLDNTGGFPMDTNVLAFMQSAYGLFNALGNLAGDLSIIQGCEVTGSNVSDGVVYINGEVLPFRGGTASPNVVIKEELKSLPFEDGQPKPVEKIRYATFGAGSPFYPWEDFKRVKNLQFLDEKKEEKSVVEKLSKKLEKLEERLNKTVPLGLVAVWNKPANIPIPEGWQECTDLRGKVPVGYNPNYTYNSYSEAENYRLNTIGATGGELSHQLTKAELPRHKHSTGSYNKFSAKAQDVDKWTVNQVDFGNAHAEYAVGGMAVSDWQNAQEKEVGDNEVHNNMPPYRVIQFIEFIGFQ